LVGRIEQRHKEVEGFFAGVLVSLSDVSFPAQFPDVVGGLRAVVSVSDVKAGDLFKSTLKKLSIFGGAAPQHMLHAIVALDFAPWLSLSNLIHALNYCLLIVSEG
jgi:hypothetical protein